MMSTTARLEVSVVTHLTDDPNLGRPLSAAARYLLAGGSTRAYTLGITVV
jgi:hypothetical protein